MAGKLSLVNYATNVQASALKLYFTKSVRGKPPGLECARNLRTWRMLLSALQRKSAFSNLRHKQIA
jgi:hypothetical protein